MHIIDLNPESKKYLNIIVNHLHLKDQPGTIANLDTLTLSKELPTDWEKPIIFIGETNSQNIHPEKFKLIRHLLYNPQVTYLSLQNIFEHLPQILSHLNNNSSNNLSFLLNCEKRYSLTKLHNLKKMLELFTSKKEKELAHNIFCDHFFLDIQPKELIEQLKRLEENISNDTQTHLPGTYCCANELFRQNISNGEVSYSKTIYNFLKKEQSDQDILASIKIFENNNHYSAEQKQFLQNNDWYQEQDYLSLILKEVEHAVGYTDKYTFVQTHKIFPKQYTQLQKPFCMHDCNAKLIELFENYFDQQKLATNLEIVQFKHNFDEESIKILINKKHPIIFYGYYLFEHERWIEKYLNLSYIDWCYQAISPQLIHQKYQAILTGQPKTTRHFIKLQEPIPNYEKSKELIIGYIQKDKHIKDIFSSFIRELKKPINDNNIIKKCLSLIKK